MRMSPDLIERLNEKQKRSSIDLIVFILRLNGVLDNFDRDLAASFMLNLVV